MRSSADYNLLLRKSIIFFVISLLILSTLQTTLQANAENNRDNVNEKTVHHDPNNQKEMVIDDGESGEQDSLSEKNNRFSNEDHNSHHTTGPKALNENESEGNNQNSNRKKQPNHSKDDKPITAPNKVNHSNGQGKDGANLLAKKNDQSSAGISLFATTQRFGDFEYKINDGNGITILVYYGNETDVTIPGEIEGKPVTEIAARAFTLSNQLGHVEIPNTVKKIKNLAFEKTGITSLVLPEGLIEIESNAFALNRLTNVTLPSSLQILGGRAFAENALEEITVPGSVKVIMGNTFAGNNLKSVTIENGVKEIGAHSFALNQIQSLTIPESVEKIGLGAFTHNEIASLTLPNSDLRIDAEAFRKNKLTTVSIPPKINFIEHRAFTDNELSEVYIHTTAFNPQRDTGDYFSENQANPKDLTIYGYEMIRGYVEGQGFTFVPFDEDIVITEGPEMIEITYDRRILLMDLKNNLWNEPIIVTLETGEEAQIPIHNISNGDPNYDYDTPGTYTFTADFNLEGLTYTNPHNFFVTFKVTTEFDVRETIGKKKDQGAEKRETDEEGKIDITTGGKGGPDIKTTDTISTTTKKGTLPNTATTNYTLILIGLSLLLLGTFTFLITTRRRQKVHNE